MFRFKPRATLGLIFFTVLIQKSEKQWKVLSGCLKNLPSGIPEGKFFQTTTADFPLFIPDNLYRLSTVCPRVQSRACDIFLAPCNTYLAPCNTFLAPCNTVSAPRNTFLAKFNTFLAPYYTSMAKCDTF